MSKLAIGITFGFILLSIPTYAVNSSDLNQNLDNLNKQIRQLNKDLSDKQRQKQKFDQALKDSQGAIQNSEQLLQKLRQKRDLEVTQLNQLAQIIPEITESANQAQAVVGQSINQIYQQIQSIHSSQQSILSGNSSLDTQRKETYLIQILVAKQNQYKQLSAQLTQLQDLNDKLAAEIDRLDDKLGETRERHQQLLDAKKQTSIQASNVQRQIIKERQRLSDLKQRQVQLNRLLNQLAQAERKQKQQQLEAAKQANKSKNTKNNSTSTSSGNTNLASQSKARIDTSIEDNSPFLSRKLFKPINGKVIVSFGQMRDSVPNNGVLLSTTDNTPVFSISDGTVLFSGELPGFGQIIVIDHGDNYTSVYSGVISRVSRGSKIKAGALIAVSGNDSNQPMGGVYFELRHLGKPVNPSKLFN